VKIGKLAGMAAMAKGLIDKRGGTGALKEDATELKDIATGQGSLTDKAKRAAEALKDPGAPGEDAARETRPPQAPPGDPSVR
jgi:hypothetical protein